MKTKTEYHLMMINDGIIVLRWEFDSKEQALEIYNEKKDSKVYKDFEWKLEQIETTVTNIELN